MKTPLFDILQNAIGLAKRSSMPKQPGIDELLDIELAKQANYSRRDFLDLSTKAMAFAGLSTIFPKPIFAMPPSTKVAIIGGGLAGLSAAYYLKRAGVQNLTIYEADNRLGGRVRTLKNTIGKNLLTEAGGEFVDSTHKDVLRLVRDADLEVIDIFRDPLALKMNAFFFEGRHYTMEEIANEFRVMLPLINSDFSTVDRKYKNEGAQRLDNIPLEKYIDNLKGSTGLTKLLKAAYTAEFGLETGVQSSLNFLELVDKELKGEEMKIYGNNDKRYKIKGGNSQLIQYLTKYLEDNILMDMRLSEFSATSKGINMFFNDKQLLQADLVIIALPFSVLRTIPFEVENLPIKKSNTIQLLGYGTNAKLMMGFNYRMWRSRGYMGNLFNEFVHNGWDNGLFQNQLQNKSIEGGYTVYLGGEAGETVKKGMEKEMTDFYLPILDGAFPKFAQSYNGLSAVADWTSNQNSLGSYACHKVGQKTTLPSFDDQSMSNVLFAGEHCSRNFKGTMNGAIESGRIAAQLIISSLKLAP